MTQPLTVDYLEQLRRGIEQASKENIKRPEHEIQNVVLAGYGNWDIAARMVQTLLADKLPVPVVCLLGEAIPAFVNEHTLVVILAEPTAAPLPIGLIDVAVCSRALVVCCAEISSLPQLASYEKLAFIAIPEEFCRHFSTIGYAITQVLAVLKQYEVLTVEFTAQLVSAMALVDKREYFIQDGAENLALGLKNKWPVLYGDEKFEPVLRWFQFQINRVSKQQAHVRTFREIAAAEIEAWQHPGSLLLDTMIVLLTTRFDGSSAPQLIEAIRTKVVPQSGGIAEVMLLYGDSFLEQALYALHLFDWTAYFLAKENQEKTK